MQNTCDFLLIGGGIIGICLAREIKKNFPQSRVILIEKESHCGVHSSGRNSGVLHAGFYYSADSLKAKFTKIGNKLLTSYCEEKKILLNKCGKLVVAKNQEEIKGLHELKRRAELNGVALDLITAKEAKEIEPKVKTFEHALFSPTTSSVNPSDVINEMVKDAQREGIEILTNTAYIKKTINGILTSKGLISSGYVINCAGLYADTIAKDFGFSVDYRILPFKGLYLYVDERACPLRTNIYPVPDLQYPFLGVHYTINSKGKVKIGPTALPALWREQYDFYNRFKLSELLDILARQMSLFVSSEFDFKRLAFTEIQKQSKRKMLALASELVEDVDISKNVKWGPPGIRAQLVDIKKKKLVSDFVIEGDENSLHVLNAVSPGFTCGLSFASYVSDTVKSLLTTKGRV